MCAAPSSDIFWCQAVATFNLSDISGASEDGRRLLLGASSPSSPAAFTSKTPLSLRMSERAPKKSSSSPKGVPHKRPRKRLNCEPCRNAKLRCNRQQPCAACKRRECEVDCVFQAPGEALATTPLRPLRTTPLGSPHYLHQHHLSTSRTTPCQDTESRHGEQQQPLSTTASLDAVLERPAFGQDEVASGLETTLSTPFAFGPKVPMSELLGMLPSATLREYLITRYFAYQDPLFRILHGPSFQKQYTSFTRDPAQTSLSWLALLFVVCSSAVLTLDAGDPIMKEYTSINPEIHTYEPMHLSRHFRSTALTCLAQAGFMVRYDLNTLEALLVMIYGICHSEGVDRGWAYLGVALNLGIALRCNVDSESLDCVEKKRRQQCWAGIRLLHTYQGLLFRDIDTSFLLTKSTAMPGALDDENIHGNEAHQPSTQRSSSSLMYFKIRLFELSTRVCSRLSDTTAFDEAAMNHYNSLIASEQRQWDSAFLVDGSASLLDTASYAYWCILQTYAHQLYLLIHRPFFHSQSSKFLSSSRQTYVQSSVALLDIHQQICELPTLRPYRWLANGMTSFNALQGAVALAACLMDRPGQTETSIPESQRLSFDAAVQRIELLQKSSPVSARAFPSLRDLQ